ncbi:MAG: P1 family peptidase [Hyphomicrobium sp.]
MTSPPDTRKPRARDIGLTWPGATGPHNAITDVPGIEIGFTTILEDAPRAGRKRPLRSGVTAILPHAASPDPVPVYAGLHRFNGNGEMTGAHWIEDGGYFLGPVLLTNTHSVGIAHHAAISWMLRRYPHVYDAGEPLWLMPVVAETYDGLLSDINGQHVTADDVFAALDSVSPGPVAEGNTGGGAGMIAYGFKGGTGTASRRVTIDGKDYAVGILVQANHGVREWFTVRGIAVGQRLGGAGPGREVERGSIIVVIATDIPMAPHQLKRVARRGAIGIGRGGTPGGNSSGDIFLAFSTANAQPMPHRAPTRLSLEILNDEVFDAIYMAVVDGVEEAVLNAMLAATDAGGTAHDVVFVPALRADELMAVLATFGAG